MEKILYSRRSVREFSDKEVANDLLLKIIDAGIKAPSAKNQQPWEFIVVDDKNLLDKISENGSPLYAKCNKAIILCFKNYDLKTPHMVIQDMGACCENMLLMATSLGIGACWIGTYPHEDRRQNLRQCLNIPDNLEPFCAIVLGYPAKDDAFKEVSRTAKVYYNRF